MIMANKLQSKIENLSFTVSNLRKEIAFLRSILRYLPGIIYWKDRSGHYLGCNQFSGEFVKKMGITKTSKLSEILGKTDYDLFDKKTAQRYAKNDRIVVNKQKTITVEEVLTLSDGRVVNQLTMKHPLYDEKNKVIGIVGISIDITERKKMEEDLRKAKLAAEAADKAKSEFIANMSHDIRTPITGILGLAQEFYENATTINAKNDAKTLMSATHELLNLLNEIIDVVGLVSTDMETKEEDFSLRALISHNISLLKPATKHKKLVMTATIDKKIPDYLHGNRRYLDRILLNILSNAVKFTNKGSVDLTVIKHSKSKNKIKLQFAIRDTGIGIPKNKQKAIFQHFSRLNPSYQGIYKGSGLGLYTVKQYLRSMRGNIRVSGKEGKGSAFFVTIPFLICKQQRSLPKSNFTLTIPEAIQPLTISQSSASQENTNITVLAVEDSPLAARMLQQTLQKLNCKVTVVNNGEEAVNTVINGDYDLVFSC